MRALWLQQRATSEVTAMEDFDLSQALDIDSVEQLPNSYSCSEDDREDMNFPFDMDLVITYNRKSFQRVANLVVVINKMKKPLTGLGQELSDQQLCNAVLENLIEDTTVEMLESRRKKGKFQRANSGHSCTLCDEAQKDVIHNSEMLRLHAITLKGGNHEKKVIFQMTRYTECSSAKQSVILSIKNSNLYLTCSMQGMFRGRTAKIQWWPKHGSLPVLQNHHFSVTDKV
ncbi:interleukin-1 beta isoform X2 [Boleophthalmus pectinirostris]|uniref:interleukin-1 beta isoform X2 n=1 Tax=Boleophthalmus pectinirostris TaxID=150288 RepID=UPI00243277C8|nr:interleukin-1 beta isoform X2 [Boleophthalmus pectinirostris]